MLTRDSLCTPAFFQNPYAVYAELRSYGRPFWLPHTQDTSLGGLWLFSRYEDGLQVFKQGQGISKNLRSVRPPGSGTAFDLHMLHRDGADHLRLRRLVSEHFSLQAMPRLHDLVAEEAQVLLRALAGRREFDLVADFAECLPLRVVARWVGVPGADMSRVREWSLALADGFDSLLSSPVVLARQRQALAEFLAYAGELVRACGDAPEQSLLGCLAHAGAVGLIEPDELVAMVGFLLFAGHETSVSLIGSGLWLLLSHPEQWRALRDDAGLIPGAVEEVLRFESPEQRTSFRVAREALEIGGARVEAGQQVGVIIGSLNRDETVFERADSFDIRRQPNQHLAFGAGLHNCLGKSMARTQAATAIRLVLQQFPNLRLLPGAPQWRSNSFFRGLRALRATGGCA